MKNRVRLGILERRYNHMLRRFEVYACPKADLNDPFGFLCLSKPILIGWEWL